MPHGENLYEGEHQGIIDRDLFHRAKLLLERWTDRRPGPGFNPDYFLRGLLRCGCGGAMTPASTKQVGRVYRYYRCSVRDKNGTQRCAARQLPAHAIEDFVLARIRDAVASGVLPDALAARLSRVREPKEQAIADRAALDDPNPQGRIANPTRASLAGSRKRVLRGEAARPDLWEPRVSNRPGPPGQSRFE